MDPARHQLAEAQQGTSVARDLRKAKRPQAERTEQSGHAVGQAPSGRTKPEVIETDGAKKVEIEDRSERERAECAKS
jgi:hypothetical protein